MSSLSSSSAPPSRKLLQSSRPNTPHFPIADPPQPLTVDSDVVVILAALLCALICVVGLALVARCAWLRRTPPSPSNPNSTPHPPPPNKGLKKKAIKSLPKFAFHSSPSSPSDSCSKAVECPICLQEFAEGDEIRILPQCEHIFHVSCVDTWLGSHSSCPFCRQVLVVSSSAPAPAPLRCQKCGADSSAAATAAVEGDGNRFLP